MNSSEQPIQIILNGDCLEVLREISDESIQCIVTSPPYWGLRDYGVEGQLGLEKTPEEYVQKMVEVFREVRRVLKKDGTVWLNLGDSYAHTIRTHNSKSEKQNSMRGSIMDTPERDFTSAGLKTKDLVGIPWRVAFALQADGWYLRQDIIWHKSNPMPESVRDRCTKAHEYIFLLTKSPKYYFDIDAIKEPAKYSGPHSPKSIKSPYSQGFTRNASWRGSQFHTGKTGEHQLGRSSKNRGHLPGNKTHKGITAYESGDEKMRISAGLVSYAESVRENPELMYIRQKRSVWTVSTKPFKGSHFATFPPDLIEPCILAGSRPGDLVLDPFAGAGTTGVVCKKHGRNFVGIELNPEYVAIVERRIAGAVPGNSEPEEVDTWKCEIKRRY